MLRKILPLTLVISLWLTTALPTLAQETPPGEPDAPAVTLSDEQQVQNDIEAQARVNNLSRRNISGYRLAYLIKDDQDSVISASNIADKTGAIVVNSWEEFSDLNEDQPFQIVLLQNSILDEIDISWIQEAYRNGVIIVGINIEMARFAELTGDQCMGKKYADTKFVDQDFFIYFTYAVQVTDTTAIDAVHQAELENCESPKSQKFTSITHGATSSWLESPADVQDLVNALLSDTVIYQMQSQNDPMVPLP